MMKWLTIVSLLVRLALQVFSYLERRQALNEGEQKALRELEEVANELVTRARAVRASVTHTPDELMRDPYNDAASEGTKPETDPPGSV